MKMVHANGVRRKASGNRVFCIAGWLVCVIRSVGSLQFVEFTFE